jgi:AbrB family looped-hinge helix DNA binding protein
MTRLSGKGQVVIPNELREQMGLKEGTKFIVMGAEDIIILRRLELSRERMELKRLLWRLRKRAERVGFTEKEVDQLIHSFRKVSG